MTARFATTRWSQVLAARGGLTETARAALEALCAAYWYPLYAWVRRQGHGSEEARDLVQGFFVHVLTSNLLEVADASRGRFRSYLLTSLRNFMSHEREKAQALKRGGDALLIPIDGEEAEARFRLEPPDDVTPEVLYERRWAMMLMERAMTRLGRRKANQLERFECLKSYLTDSYPTMPYEEAAERLGTSEGAVRVAVHRLRKEFGEVLREEIVETVADASHVDDELLYLLNVVGESRP